MKNVLWKHIFTPINLSVKYLAAIVYNFEPFLHQKNVKNAVFTSVKIAVNILNNLVGNSLNSA